MLQMRSRFNALVRTHPDSQNVEFWFARDLREPLGYEPAHHLRGVTKLITHAITASTCKTTQPSGFGRWNSPAEQKPRLNRAKKSP